MFEPVPQETFVIGERLGEVLRIARKSLGLSQRVAALRAGVSTRLWAEVERGERPNVSLATALRMLGEVGVSVRLTDPRGDSTRLRDTSTIGSGRAARAAVRRATWTGRQILLADEGSETPSARKGSARLAAVARVSEQALAIARGTRRPGARATVKLSVPSRR